MCFHSPPNTRSSIVARVMQVCLMTSHTSKHKLSLGPTKTSHYTYVTSKISAMCLAYNFLLLHYITFFSGSLDIFFRLQLDTFAFGSIRLPPRDPRLLARIAPWQKSAALLHYHTYARRAIFFFLIENTESYLRAIPWR